MKRPAPIAAIALALAALSSSEAGTPPHADTPARRILLDRRLVPAIVSLRAIGDGMLSYGDDSGLIRSQPLRDALAILPGAGSAHAESGDGAAAQQAAEPAPASLRAPYLELTDGQRWPGALVPDGAGDSGMLRWEHPALGRWDIPLDAVASVVLAPARDEPGEPVSADVAVLTNGDRVAGFVESIGAEVRIDSDGRMVAAPLERVAAVRLANPRVPPSGVMLWLADGSVVRAGAMSTDRFGVLTVEPIVPGGRRAADAGAAGLRCADVLAAAFDAGALTPLASLAIVEQGPLPPRRWGEPARVGAVAGVALGAADVELPGPMRARWSLPPGASRFGADVELPSDCRVWGDCELIVSLVRPGQEGVELARVRLDAASPEARMNVELPRPGAGPAMLELRVEPGASGPVQDRVVVHRGLVVVEGP